MFGAKMEKFIEIFFIQYFGAVFDQILRDFHCDFGF